MASSSTFKIGKKVTENYICFAELIRNVHSKSKYIIIEKEKFFFPKYKIKEYLEDLKEVVPYNGFEVKKDGIMVDVSNITTKFELKVLSMAIRYLWEGKFVAGGSDKFYYIVEGYFKVKKYYPSNTVTKNLCLAHAYALQYMGAYMNTNHMWGGKTGILIKDKLEPNDKFNAVGSATFREHIKLPTDFRKPKRWTKKKFDELLKHYEQY